MPGPRFFRAVAALAAAALTACGCLPNEIAVSKERRLAFFAEKEGLLVTDPILPDAKEVRARVVAKEAFGPSFSPDGAHLAFVAEPLRERSTERACAIVVCGADGGDRRDVLTTEGRAYRVRFSPDGKRLAYVYEEKKKEGGEAVCALGVFDLASGESRKLLENVGWFYEWAPGGRAIAAWQTEGGFAGDDLRLARLVIREIEGENEEVRGLAIVGAFAPLAFSRGGKEVRFLSLPLALPSAALEKEEGKRAPRAIATLAAFGPKPKAIAAEAVPPETSYFAASPDGRSELLFGGLVMEEKKSFDLRVRRRGATGIEERVVSGVSARALPAWLSDREIVYFREGKLSLYDVETGSEREVALEVEPQTPLALGPDSYFDGAIVASYSAPGGGPEITIAAKGSHFALRAKKGRWKFADGTLNAALEEGSFEAVSKEASGLSLKGRFARGSLGAALGKASLRLEGFEPFCPGARVKAKGEVGAIEIEVELAR